MKLYKKTFEVHEFTDLSTLNYVIEVRFRGKVIERFDFPTLRQSLNAFQAAGYVRAE